MSESNLEKHTAGDRITYKAVRDDHEWAEFFVRETTVKRADGALRHSATFTSNSSFGVYGYHWSHMGEPFADFIKDLDPDYLVGKISRQVFDRDKYLKWIRRAIFTSDATKKVKAAAARRVREIDDEYGCGEGLAMAVYLDPEVSHCRIDFSDGDSMSPDPQAVMFAERMWPLFVAEMQPAASIAKASPTHKEGVER